jgi:TetR/AcrR family transcriptional regulator, ethionamide resistance regulator
MSTRSEAFDRRPAGSGDQRRTALLTALDELLHEQSLDEITVADVTKRAGVTRPAFYFYFENMPACVAALGLGMYEEAVSAAEHMFTPGLSPRERVERMIEDLFRTRERHHYIYQATLDAARRSSALREMWDGYRESFVPPVATLITSERAAGHAPPGPDAATLAVMLLDLSDRVLERLAPGTPESSQEQAHALAAIWLRTIYGVIDQEHLELASSIPEARSPQSH